MKSCDCVSKQFLERTLLWKLKHNSIEECFFAAFIFKLARVLITIVIIFKHKSILQLEQNKKQTSIHAVDVLCCSRRAVSVESVQLCDLFTFQIKPKLWIIDNSYFKQFVANRSFKNVIKLQLDISIFNTMMLT